MRVRELGEKLRGCGVGLRKKCGERGTGNIMIGNFLRYRAIMITVADVDTVGRAAPVALGPGTSLSRHCSQPAQSESKLLLSSFSVPRARPKGRSESAGRGPGDAPVVTRLGLGA